MILQGQHDITISVFLESYAYNFPSQANSENYKFFHLKKLKIATHILKSKRMQTPCKQSNTHTYSQPCNVASMQRHETVTCKSFDRARRLREDQAIMISVLQHIQGINSPGTDTQLALETFLSEVSAVMNSPGEHTLAAMLTEALTTGDKTADSATQNLLSRCQLWHP